MLFGLLCHHGLWSTIQPSPATSAWSPSFQHIPQLDAARESSLVSRTAPLSASRAQAERRRQTGAGAEAERYAREPWNLNALPTLGLLAHLEDPIPGVQTPWLYIGSMFSSAAWQMEDHMLYSVAYHHVGEPRCWCAMPLASEQKGFAEPRIPVSRSQLSGTGLTSGVMMHQFLGFSLCRMLVLNTRSLHHRFTWHAVHRAQLSRTYPTTPAS